MKSCFRIWQGLFGPLAFFAIVTLVSAWGFSRNHRQSSPAKIEQPRPAVRRGPVVVNSGMRTPDSPEFAQGNPWHPTPLQVAPEEAASK